MSTTTKPAATKPFTPSSWLLEQQIARAMKACDHDIEQQRLAREAAKEARIARAWEAEAKARYYARIQRGE